jgi:hypothetical protein
MPGKRSTSSKPGSGSESASAKIAKARHPSPKSRRGKSSIDKAITTELAPAAAIALLAKTEKSPDSLAPALDILAAGVSAAESDGKVRVQLVFDGGEVLPVEMSVQAGEVLARGLSKELASHATEKS